MKKVGCFFLLAPLLALLVLAGAVDVFAKTYAEDQIAAAVEHRSGGRVGHATASISSVPFVGRMLAYGDVDHVDITMGTLKIDQPVDALTVHIDGLHMDRDALLGEGHVRMKGVDRVTVSVLIAAARLQALADGVGVQLGFAPGVVTAAGRPLQVSAGEGLLTVQGAGIPPLSVPVPVGDALVLPCQPAAAVVAAGVELSCTATHVPDLLVEAIGATAFRNG